MSKIAEKLRAATSKRAGASALLVLEDGTVFAGTSCGAPGEAFGEICFNTSMEGYLEIVTDLSYAGQIVVLTYPQVGNYGVNADDAQAERPALRALVVRDMCPTPSSWRSQESLGDYLAREGVVAIEGVDTRALVRHIRDHGAQRAVVSTEDTDVAALLVRIAPADVYAAAAVDALLLLVACGVGVLVWSGTYTGAMDQLLEEGDYTRKKKARSGVMSTVSLIYWLSVTAIFLFYTFGPKGNGQPQYSWFIWAVGGVLYAAVMGIVSLVLYHKDKI